MLSGFIEYRYNNKKFHYDVEARDTSDSMSLWMTSANYNAVMFLEDPFVKDSSTALDDRRVDISLTKVTVETLNFKNKSGKNEKSPINTEFFCRLGSLIRWSKMNCSTFNEEGYTGLQLASGEFDISPEKVYIIKAPTDESIIIAKVTLKYGEISYLEVKTNDFTIELEEDFHSEVRVFKSIKNGAVCGFRFTSEYLGFELKPQIIINSVSSDGMYHSLEEIIRVHPDKEFRWLLQKDYKIVIDENLDEICEYILNYDGYVYYDTETTGLNITFKSRVGQADQLVGVVLSVKYGESFYFPLQMKKIKNLCDGDHWYVMEHYMRPILEGKKLVAHNMSFDWKVAYIYNINANIVHDTLAILKLTLGAERKDFKVGLKECAKLLLGRDSLEISDLIIDDSWGQSDIKFWDLPEDLVRLYACADTDNTNGLLAYAEQADLLNKYNAKKVYEIEIAFSYAVAYQEFFGHRIDVNNIDTMREEVVQAQELCMEKMVEIVGHPFNPNSPPQLIQILYTELGIPQQISRKTGRPTTDAETMKKLAEITDAEDNVKYPFVRLLLKFREYEGVRKIIDQFPETATADGYIFSHVMQYGTTTGRVSINTPNYQSYNNPVKKQVVPRPGFYMFDTDYSSVEYRVLGNMVGNKNIMHSFEDPDFDYHQYQAARMYGVPYSSVTKTMRKAAKGINFGLPYGMGDESLGVRVFGEESPENTRKAAALRAAYFKGQEDIRDWFEFHRNKGVTMGYTETFFNRRRYYRKEDFSVAAIRRQAGNQVIQGCLSWASLLQSKELGIVKIGSVVGETLNLWDGYDWTKGTIVYSGKKQKCIVHFKGGQDFVCSPDHRFCVRSHRGNDRFVRCEDLVGCKDKANRSGHRVVISPNYEQSDYMYSSDKYRRKFKSYANNANRLFIDDLNCTRYEAGIVLGRLASDGSYSYDKDSIRSRIIHIIAEHEEEIMSSLFDWMSEWDADVKYNELRENRNEKVHNIIVHSLTLTRELQELDIRHTIHDDIFKDTELLRGFLCGFFDGDGGISGKTITLVQGTQYDFEPMFKDIQKALLFFGIRSRYRKYDDRYVIQIKTTDNERFLDVIGFLNYDKQMQGRELECIEDEHIFGKCLMVDYVEFTDEYIDMYDVCNTDRGYYVADGIITHNSAADIYKTAVGRVFKRICKEGWLGKVLLTGFIHDELLGEVSTDINPGVFLKALREEFEVKIVNDDGTPWCPLYMGFGYGMSWYEAKSVELPIKLQWEFEREYGVEGFPDWIGNGRAFCDTIPDRLRDFEVRDIRNQITDEGSQGKEIKTTLNNQILAMVKEDSEIYPKAIEEYLQGDVAEVQGMGVDDYLVMHEEDLCRWLNENYHIQSLLKDSDGKVVTAFKPTTVTQDALSLYCALHGVERASINLLDIAEVSNVSVGQSQSFDSDDESAESLSTAEKLQIMINNRIDTLGVYVDIDNKIIYLMLVGEPYLKFIQDRSNHDGIGYNIYFRDSLGLNDPNKKGTLFSTKAYIKSEDIGIIQQMYINLFKNMK